MEIKEQIKRKIDQIPEELLPGLIAYLERLIRKEQKELHDLPSFHLGGKFDKVDVRSEAYE